MILWCLQLGSQFSLFSMIRNRLHLQMLFYFACDTVRQEARKLRKKNNPSSQEAEMTKQTVSPRQRPQSSFILTSNLCWDFPICWCWEVHRILAQVQDLKVGFFFSFSFFKAEFKSTAAQETDRRAGRWSLPFPGWGICKHCDRFQRRRVVSFEFQLCCDIENHQS